MPIEETTCSESPRYNITGDIQTIRRDMADKSSCHIKKVKNGYMLTFGSEVYNSEILVFETLDKVLGRIRTEFGLLEV